MNEDTWFRIDRSGFFPHENESEASFILSYKELVSSPASCRNLPDSWLIQARKHFHSIFHAIPCWVTSSVSKKGILPWELAACWQYADGRSDLQIKPEVLKLQEKTRVMVLFHELIHASRARIQSLCFEEVIAYEAMNIKQGASLWTLRCWLSRLCIAPSDPFVFLLYHLIFFISLLMGSISLLWYCLLIGFFWGSLVVRAIWLGSTWKKAFQNIECAFPEKGWRFFLRATDCDILWLASLPSDTVFDYVMRRALHDWRWNYLVVCALS